MNTEVKWKLKGATGNEVKELQDARMFPSDELTLRNVSLVLPLGEKIPQGHALTFRNVHLNCGVCKKDFKIPDFQLGVTDSLWMEPDIESDKGCTCPHCGSTKKILGIETDAADGSPRYWVVIRRITHPASYPVNLMTSEVN
jgi:DNA-directed RNA polymerase subunit RPC12/RpoP